MTTKLTEVSDGFETDIDPNTFPLTSGVVSVNEKSGVVTLNADEIPENPEDPVNQYFTADRAKGAVVVDDLEGDDVDRSPSIRAVKEHVDTIVDTTVGAATTDHIDTFHSMNKTKRALVFGRTANNVAAGTSIAGINNIRVLTDFNDPDGIVTVDVVLNQITFPPGKYYIRAYSNQYDSGYSFLWLYDVDTAAAVPGAWGMTGYSHTTYPTQITNSLEHILVVPEETTQTIQIRQYHGTAIASGLGLSANSVVGFDSINTMVSIEKYT